jgi:hypothetical protein
MHQPPITMRRLTRYGLLLAMLVGAILLGLDLMYLVRGSLEQFPTEEQEDKVRIVTVVLGVLLLVVEVGLWMVFRYVSRDDRRTRMRGGGPLAPAD